MSGAPTVARILRDHVVLDVECINRMYLNLYVPILQSEAGTAWFFREQRKQRFASSALMAPMSRAFVTAGALRPGSRHPPDPLREGSTQRRCGPGLLREVLRARGGGLHRQYFKEGRGLRTETTINNAHDFRIGRRLYNLPALQDVGFRANRRLLDVQRLSHNCWIGEAAFAKVHSPQVVHGQRVPALRFGDPRVVALLAALLVCCLLPRGFSNQDLRERMAVLMGIDPDDGAQ